MQDFGVAYIAFMNKAQEIINRDYAAFDRGANGKPPQLSARRVYVLAPLDA